MPCLSSPTAVPIGCRSQGRMSRRGGRTGEVGSRGKAQSAVSCLIQVARAKSLPAVDANPGLRNSWNTLSSFASRFDSPRSSEPRCRVGRSWRRTENYVPFHPVRVCRLPLEFGCLGARKLLSALQGRDLAALGVSPRRVHFRRFLHQLG